MNPTPPRPVLELEALEKHFGAVQALAGVDLELRRGEVLGLVGDNGAGKSTLLRLIAGNFRPSAGAIRLDGEPMSFARPLEARRAGVAVVYQDLALCDNLSAAENVFLGSELRRRALGIVPVLDRQAMQERTGVLFAELQSDTDPAARVGGLSGGQRQAIAIARSRLHKPRIVLLDEPTAAISIRQVEQVLSMIRRLKQQGSGVVLVSHRLSDVFAVCDRIAVLRRGRKVSDLRVEATNAEQVTALITGALESVPEAVA